LWAQQVFAFTVQPEQFGMKNLASWGDSLKKAGADLGDSLKLARDEAMRKAAITKGLIVEQAAAAKEILVEQATVAKGRIEQGWTPPVLDAVVELIPQDGDFFVEIIEARDVPKVDLFIPSDPYILGYMAVQIEGGTFKRISEFVKTPVKMDNDNPIWHLYANFQCTPPPDAFLTLCLYNFDRAQILSAQLVNNSRLLGTVRIPVAELSSDEEPRRFNLDFLRFGSKDSNPGFSVAVRRAFLRGRAPERRVLFLVRHGESQWNRAVATKDVAALMALDHPLTPTGVQQAQALARQWREARDALAAEDAADAADAAAAGPKSQNGPAGAAGGAAAMFSERRRRAEYLRAFLAAEAVYSSPLTRALQVRAAALRRCAAAPQPRCRTWCKPDLQRDAAHGRCAPRSGLSTQRGGSGGGGAGLEDERASNRRGDSPRLVTAGGGAHSLLLRGARSVQA
jgi:hypothetical protein